MADVLLFHHAHGLTHGLGKFADVLRAEGHSVTTPDLYEGRVFEDLDEGVAYAHSVGIDAITAAGVALAETFPAELVYAGFSLGAMPAQKLAQTRPGARAALLYHAGLPTRWFEAPWPAGLPLQLHVTEADEWAELAEVQELAGEAEGSELYVYPGSAHLFTDSSLDDYDEGLAALVLERTLSLLDRLDRQRGPVR